jgi:hypothetical protein
LTLIAVILAPAFALADGNQSSPPEVLTLEQAVALALEGNRLRIDVSSDVNETAAIVLEAKRSGGKSAVFICGGGSPKNFLLQTEPQIQEVLGLARSTRADVERDAPADQRHGVDGRVLQRRTTLRRALM